MVWKAVLLILLAVCDTSILVSHTEACACVLWMGPRGQGHHLSLLGKPWTLGTPYYFFSLTNVRAPISSTFSYEYSLPTVLLQLRSRGTAQLCCPQLTSLILAGCSSVTDEGVQALAAACPHLTSLDLDGCTSVTDMGLRALASGCPQLTALDLGSSSSVTDEGLAVLMEGCPQLT
eukprot:SAG25_NODE_806_length_5254_cov_1897.297963_3_plen_176_part_00